MGMDVVDYKIYGAEMQFVEVELDPKEAMVGEAGSLMFMEEGIDMDHPLENETRRSLLKHSLSESARTGQAHWFRFAGCIGS